MLISEQKFSRRQMVNFQKYNPIHQNVTIKLLFTMLVHFLHLLETASMNLIFSLYYPKIFCRKVLSKHFHTRLMTMEFENTQVESDEIFISDTKSIISSQ